MQLSGFALLQSSPKHAQNDDQALNRTKALNRTSDHRRSCTAERLFAGCVRCMLHVFGAGFRGSAVSFSVIVDLFNTGPADVDWSLRLHIRWQHKAKRTAVTKHANPVLPPCSDFLLASCQFHRSRPGGFLAWRGAGRGKACAADVSRLMHVRRRAVPIRKVLPGCRWTARKNSVLS